MTSSPGGLLEVLCLGPYRMFEVTAIAARALSAAHCERTVGIDHCPDDWTAGSACDGGLCKKTVTLAGGNGTIHCTTLSVARN